MREIISWTLIIMAPLIMLAGALKAARTGKTKWIKMATPVGFALLAGAMLLVSFWKAAAVVAVAGAVVVVVNWYLDRRLKAQTSGPRL